jgi:hypothetical protein
MIGNNKYNKLKEHEYGHNLAWRQLGILAFLPSTGSVITTQMMRTGIIDAKTHTSMPWEIDVNKRAVEYYGSKSHIGKDTSGWYKTKQFWE